MFNQGLFFEVGTCFSSKIDGFGNSLLWSKKTFSFNQGVFLQVGTPLSKIDDFGNSLLWSELIFTRAGKIEEIVCHLTLNGIIVC